MDKDTLTVAYCIASTLEKKARNELQFADPGDTERISELNGEVAAYECVSNLLFALREELDY